MTPLQAGALWGAVCVPTAALAVWAATRRRGPQAATQRAMRAIGGVAAYSDPTHIVGHVRIVQDQHGLWVGPTGAPPYDWAKWDDPLSDPVGDWRREASRRLIESMRAHGLEVREDERMRIGDPTPTVPFDPYGALNLDPDTE